MTDQEVEKWLLIIAGAAVGAIAGKKMNNSPWLGAAAGASVAAMAGPQVIRVLEDKLGRGLTAPEMQRLLAAIKD